MTFKQKVYQQYLFISDEKINTLQTILNELSESVKNETKSTAGDKHETALAMLQIEQENTRLKLLEATEQKIQLQKTDIETKSNQIIKGSVIKTTKGYFFLSVALGKSMINDIPVISISPQSPLGTKLLGLKVNDIAEINGIKYIVESIH